MGRGESLLADAATIGDQEGTRLWQLRKAGWVAGTVSALRGEVDGDTLESFERALRSPLSDGGVFEGLSGELEGVRRAVAVLAALAEQTARRG